MAASLEGVVACVVRAREQERVDQSRFLRGTVDARLRAWCWAPRGMSASALCAVDVVELRKVETVKMKRVMHSMAPKAREERCDSPPEWAAAQPRIRSNTRRDRVGRASDRDLLVSGRCSRLLKAVERTESVRCCVPVVRSGECAPLRASSPCSEPVPWVPRAVDRGLFLGRLVVRPVVIRPVEVLELASLPKDRRPPGFFFLGARWCSCFLNFKKKTNKKRKEMNKEPATF